MYPNLFLSGALHTYAYMHEVLDLYYQHEVLLTYMHISIYFACFVYVICFKSAHTVLFIPSPSSYAAGNMQNNSLIREVVAVQKTVKHEMKLPKRIVLFYLVLDTLLPEYMY